MGKAPFKNKKIEDRERRESTQEIRQEMIKEVRMLDKWHCLQGIHTDMVSIPRTSKRVEQNDSRGYPNPISCKSHIPD